MQVNVATTVRWVAVFLLISAWQCHAAEPIPLALDQHSNQLEVRKQANGETQLTTLGEDPFIVLQRFDPTRMQPTQTVLAFEYFAPDGLAGLSVYYGPPFTSTKQFAAGTLERSESWLPYSIDLKSLSGGKWKAQSNQLRLDFGTKAGVSLRIRNLQLREPNLEERRSHEERMAEREGKLARESQLNAFYAATFPDQVDSVSIDSEQVVIRGNIAAANGQIKLIEIRPEVSIADHAVLDNKTFVLNGQSNLLEVSTLSSNSPFEVKLSRMAGNVDRTTSRWCVAESLTDGNWQLRSHWKYATDLSGAAASNLPQQIPKGIKGMGGISSHLPLEELVELGIHNITVNIALGNLMDAAPRRGWLPFEHSGRIWYVNAGLLASYDKLMRFAAEHEIVVSGILLVTFSESEFGKMIVHPEADRAGHFAMPNLTSAEGSAAYEAVIEFLAQRYAAPEAPHGRIANWIIHNEVGFGWEWTNMGRQPPMLFMDHYLRSMRLVHNVTRRHDPHSRVFISLTHHWNTPTDPSWKSYSNVNLLNRLIESSRSEGDFAWGVAYHPYPQSLFRADAWNDTRVTNDFHTPLITPKNIAVLDRWMRTPQMHDSNGKVRGLLLSEQGFNTRDYSPDAQRLQAAGLVYMWRQMRGLTSIEAFHNHRWVDAAAEGGLLLGLRTLPAEGKPYGPKKLSWETYRALDTPAEKEVTSFANEIIGTE